MARTVAIESLLVTMEEWRSSSLPDALEAVERISLNLSGLFSAAASLQREKSLSRTGASELAGFPCPYGFGVYWNQHALQTKPRAVQKRRCNRGRTEGEGRFWGGLDSWRVSARGLGGSCACFTAFQRRCAFLICTSLFFLSRHALRRGQ